jgi:ATP-dependent Clp protease ATP-binding subunit ClpC
MFNFDLNKTAIIQAVRWERHPAFRFAKPLGKLFLFLFIILTLIFLFGFLTYTFDESVLAVILGFAIIFLTLSISLRIRRAFFNAKLKEPRLKVDIKEAVSNPEKFNLAEFLNLEVARAVYKSIRFTKKRKFPEVNSIVLFYFLLTDNPDLNFLFSRALLSLKEIKNLLKTYFKKIPVQTKRIARVKLGETFQKSILEAFKIAEEKGHLRVQMGDIIYALSKHDPIFQRVLIDSNLKVEDIENLTWWLESIENVVAEGKKFWEWKNLIKKGSIGKDWAAGYTITLDRFGTDFSETIRRRGVLEIVGHQKEIGMVERILGRGEINNCLLVGEAGVGKKSMVWGLAQKSYFGESLPEVNYKRIVQLDLVSLATQTETVAEAEVVLDTIFQEVVSAGNIILVIDNLHDFVGGKERPGVVDVSGVLAPYLNLPQFQILAITTYSGLHKYVEQKPSMLSLFEKVEVPEVSKKEALMILENLTLSLERKFKKFISSQALREIVDLAKRYLPDVPLPKSAMDLLDESMVYISSTKDKVLLPEHITRLLSEKTEIPLGKVEAKEKEVLLSLEDLLHKRIINQEIAVNEVSAALRRARAEVTVRKGPMGTFLFLGPTGVGKTETSKALAEIYFGSEERMIRLDMSEFQAVSDIPRLLGSPGEEGLLTTKVRENPFSLILLDEIEKAHPNILNLFLQVLDEGFLTDGLGRKIDFKNSIIIATSNAGYKIILDALKEKAEWSEVKEKLLDYLFEEGTFRPEFINRFDAVVVFSPLSKANLLDIAELMLQSLKKNLKEKNIEFIITEPLKEKIVELGYDPTFGAREMRRVIQDKVENVLAKAILSNQIKRGDRAEVSSDFQLKVNS